MLEVKKLNFEFKKTKMMIVLGIFMAIYKHCKL